MPGKLSLLESNYLHFLEVDTYPDTVLYSKYVSTINTFSITHTSYRGKERNPKVIDKESFQHIIINNFKLSVDSIEALLYYLRKCNFKKLSVKLHVGWHNNYKSSFGLNSGDYAKEEDVYEGWDVLRNLVTTNFSNVKITSGNTKNFLMNIYNANLKDVNKLLLDNKLKSSITKPIKNSGIF